MELKLNHATLLKMTPSQPASIYSFGLTDGSHLDFLLTDDEMMTCFGIDQPIINQAYALTVAAINTDTRLIAATNESERSSS